MPAGTTLVTPDLGDQQLLLYRGTKKKLQPQFLFS